jgi:dihydroflavonol-4-reductase
MTAFLTGGTGFIGSHLAEALVARGDRVRALVRGAPKWLAEVPGVEVVRGGLDDAAALRSGVAAADVVYHVAGVTRATDAAAFEAGNVAATTRLLEAVREAVPNVQRVVVTSSLAAVGACAGGVATEVSPLRPISRYGASKARMERALDAFSDLPLTVVRPPAVYGPREADIFTFFKTVSRGLCPVVGDPRVPALTLVHVRDLVSGMLLAADRPEAVGQTYFFGSPRDYGWGEIRDAAARALGRRVLTVRVPRALVGPIGAVSEAVGRLTGQYPPLNREKAREIRDACVRCTSGKARRELGYAPTVDLDAGIAETMDWYRQAGWL